MDNETKAMLQEILSEIKTVNTRLNSLEEGQIKLEEGQARLETKVTKLEEGQARLETKVTKLEEGQESIKQHITSNNVAIGEIITQVLENSDSKVSKIEKVTKDNLYEIALLKNAKQG